jgi:hypothetical protein
MSDGRINTSQNTNVGLPPTPSATPTSHIMGSKKSRNRSTA